MDYAVVWLRDMDVKKGRNKETGSDGDVVVEEDGKN